MVLDLENKLIQSQNETIIQDERGRLSEALGSFDKASTYEKDGTPIWTISDTDPTEYSETSGNPVIYQEAMNWNNIDGTPFNFGFTTGIFVDVDFELKGEAGLNGYARCKVNGSINGSEQSSGTGGAYVSKTITGTDSSLFDKASTTNTISIEVKGTNVADVTYVKNLYYTLKGDLSGATITPANFNYDVMYLKEVILPNNSSIKLNNSTNEIISNNTGATRTINFENGIKVIQIDIINGTPTITIYGN